MNLCLISLVISLPTPMLLSMAAGCSDITAPQAAVHQQTSGVRCVSSADGTLAITCTNMTFEPGPLFPQLAPHLPTNAAPATVGWLTLKGGSLTRLTENALDGFTCLKKFVCAHNSTLETIDASWITPCTHTIETVEIKNCRACKKMYNDFPEEAANLRLLRITDTILPKISSVGALLNLTTIDLSHNLLNELGALNDMPNLREVNLSYNKLKTVPRVDNLRLRMFDISHNLLDGELVSSRDFPQLPPDGDHCILRYNNNAALAVPIQSDWSRVRARDRAYLDFTGTATGEGAGRDTFVAAAGTAVLRRRLIQNSTGGPLRSLSVFAGLSQKATDQMEKYFAREGEITRTHVLQGFAASKTEAVYTDPLESILEERRHVHEASFAADVGLTAYRWKKTIYVIAGILTLGGAVIASATAEAAFEEGFEKALDTVVDTLTRKVDISNYLGHLDVQYRIAADVVFRATVKLLNGRAIDTKDIRETVKKHLENELKGEAKAMIKEWVITTLVAAGASIGIATLFAKLVAGGALLNRSNGDFILPRGENSVIISGGCEARYFAAAKLFAGHLLCAASVQQLRTMQLLAQFLDTHESADFSLRNGDYRELLRTIATETNGLIFTAEEAARGVPPELLIRIVQAFANEDDDRALMSVVATPAAVEDSSLTNEAAWATASERAHMPSHYRTHWHESFCTIRHFITGNGYLLRGDRQGASDFLAAINTSRGVRDALARFSTMYSAVPAGAYGSSLAATANLITRALA